MLKIPNDQNPYPHVYNATCIDSLMRYEPKHVQCENNYGKKSMNKNELIMRCVRMMRRKCQT